MQFSALLRSQQSCANCDAFKPNKQANPRAGEPRQGWCRAAPPVAVPIGQQQGIAGNLLVTQGIWPPIASNEWCRAWQATEDDDDGRPTS